MKSTSKGKSVLESAAKAVLPSKEHEAAESADHENAEREGIQEVEDTLCPSCHSKIQKFLAAKNHGSM